MRNLADESASISISFVVRSVKLTFLRIFWGDFRVILFSFVFIVRALNLGICEIIMC